jgi:hypothetical protein
VGVVLRLVLRVVAGLGAQKIGSIGLKPVTPGAYSVESKHCQALILSRSLISHVQDIRQNRDCKCIYDEELQNTVLASKGAH